MWCDGWVSRGCLDFCVVTVGPWGPSAGLWRTLPLSRTLPIVCQIPALSVGASRHQAGENRAQELRNTFPLFFPESIESVHCRTVALQPASLYIYSSSLTASSLLVFVNNWGVWALALVSSVFARAIIRRYWTSIWDIPGPLLASFSNLWQVLQILRGHTEAETIRLHQKHGKPM